MRDGRLVEPGPRVDVDRVGDLVRLPHALGPGGMGYFVLPCRREQQTSIRGEREPAEERRAGLVGVDAGVLVHVRYGRVLHGPNGGKRHARRGRRGTAHGGRGSERGASTVRYNGRIHRRSERGGSSGNRR